MTGNNALHAYKSYRPGKKMIVDIDNNILKFYWSDTNIRQENAHAHRQTFSSKATLFVLNSEKTYSAISPMYAFFHVYCWNLICLIYYEISTRILHTDIISSFLRAIDRILMFEYNLKSSLHVFQNIPH